MMKTNRIVILSRKLLERDTVRLHFGVVLHHLYRRRVEENNLLSEQNDPYRIPSSIHSSP